MLKRGSNKESRWGYGSRLMALLLGSAAINNVVWADSFQVIDGLEGQYKITLNYGVAMRTKSPSADLTNGPIDPLKPALLPPMVPGQNQLIGFGHSGLPTTINLDDGDRNFKKHALVNNRVSAYGEFGLNYENYGLSLSGDAFYDDVYNRGNDNKSAATINKDSGKTDDFTASARRISGERARLLEAYVYGDWELGETTHLNIRVGEQVVAWGESLFFNGIALSQGRADATRAFVPGAEVKEILLPTNQIGIQLGVNPELTFLGYYHLETKSSEIFPVGHYFSPADVVGPGARFAYGSINPAAVNGCPGLLNFPPLPDLSPLCNLGGIGMPLLNAPADINVPRGPDIVPTKHDQWGYGLTYQITPITNLGFYHLRYADPNPTVQLNTGFAFVGSVAGVPITTSIVNQYVPVTYQVKYWGRIDMTAMTFSTDVGPVNVAGELSYRKGVDMQVQAHISQVLAPVYTRGNLGQIDISAIHAFNPKFVFDDIALVGEVGLVHVDHVDPISAQPGILPVGNGNVLFADETAWAFQTLVLGKKRNVLPGWDATGNFSGGMIVKGDPSLSGAFGSLYGEGDKRLGIGAGMQYLQNLEFDMSYNWFFGDTDTKIGKSTLPEHPFADRDYVTFNVKYSL